MDWLSKKCKDCVFSKGHKCRRFPPQALGSIYYPVYPVVENKDACAEFKEQPK